MGPFGGLEYLAIRRFSSVYFDPGSVASDAIEGSGKDGADVVDSAPGCALRRQGSWHASQWGGLVPEFAGLPLEGQRSGSGVARKGFRSVPRSPLPTIRSRSDRASPPTTGDRASLASSRFAKVRDRPGARVSSAQGARAAGNVSQGAAFTYPEPWRFREASGSIVSVRPPLGAPKRISRRRSFLVHPSTP